VEHVPLIDPARNAFTTGLDIAETSKAAILSGYNRFTRTRIIKYQKSSKFIHLRLSKISEALFMFDHYRV